MHVEFKLPAYWSKTDHFAKVVAERISFILYGRDTLEHPPQKRDDEGWDVNPSTNDWWLYPPHTRLNDTSDWRLCARYANKDDCAQIAAILTRYL